MSFTVCQNVRSTVSGGRPVDGTRPLRCWWCKAPIDFKCDVPFCRQFLTRPVSRSTATDGGGRLPTNAMINGFTNKDELLECGQGFFVGTGGGGGNHHDGCWNGKGIFCELPCLLGLMTVEGHDVPLLGEYLRERGGGGVALSEAVARPFPPFGYWPSPLLVSNSEVVVQEGLVATQLMFGHSSSVTNDLSLSDPII
jgi:hypothetical protein